MKKLVILVVVLVILAAIAGGLAYADLRLRGMVEDRAEERIAQTLPQVQGVEVELEGFPFTLGVLLRGEVEALHVKVAAAQEQGVRVTDLSLDVARIQLDEDALVDEQRLVVTDIGEATVQAFVSDEVVSAVAKHSVVFEPGKVRVRYKGRDLEAKGRVEGRLLMFSTNLRGVPPLVMPLPSSDIIPCTPELELLAGKARLSCSMDALPAKLREAMAQQ